MIMPTVYDVMMAKKIAEELGYDLEIVKLDWDALVPAVAVRQCGLRDRRSVHHFRETADGRLYRTLLLRFHRYTGEE